MLSRRLLRIKIVKALYSHFTTEGLSLLASERNLLFSIRKSYDLYHLMMRLIVDVADYAEMVIEQRKTRLLPSEDDLHPNCRFIENRVIEQLRNSRSLNDYLQKNKLSWSNYPELIRKLYQNLSKRDYYEAYMQQEKSSYSDDKTFVIQFYTHEIEDFTDLYDVLEEMSIFWLDEVEFITSQVIKTIKTFRSSTDDICLLPMLGDDTDMDFVKTVFSKTVVMYRENLAYVESFVQNWDIERFVFLDKILLMAALVEIIECPSIPIKVTMDEYIEIAKYYSSPSSGHFINGLMHRMVQDLREQGRITKLV